MQWHFCQSPTLPLPWLPDLGAQRVDAFEQRLLSLWPPLPDTGGSSSFTINTALWMDTILLVHLHTHLVHPPIHTFIHLLYLSICPVYTIPNTSIYSSNVQVSCLGGVAIRISHIWLLPAWRLDSNERSRCQEFANIC